MLSGDNSILQKSVEAKEETISTSEAEKVQLAILDAIVSVATTPTGELTTESVKNGIKGQFGKGEEENVKGTGPWTYKGPDTGKTYRIAKDGELVEPNATIAKDSDNTEYPLPKDATYKEGTVDTGLVITYKGSEFVWIPIEKDTLYAKGTTKAMAKESSGTYSGTDDKGRTKYEGVLYDNNLTERTGYGQSTTSYREPSDLQATSYGGDWSTTADKGFELIIRHIDEYKGLENNSTNQATIKKNWAKQLQEEYDAMIESVKNYGGFYVGRYETSTDIKSVKDATPISAETVIDGYSQTWYGLYQRQKNFTSSSDSMVASMIWGSQYDAMLNWAQASGTENASYVTQTGHANHNYSETQKTGVESRDVINNIYDLEGNMFEWTLEAYSTSRRVHCGGDYLDSVAPASHNVNVYPYKILAFSGSRLTLYIK